MFLLVYKNKSKMNQPQMHIGINQKDLSIKVTLINGVKSVAILRKTKNVCKVVHELLTLAEGRFFYVARWCYSK